MAEDVLYQLVKQAQTLTLNEQLQLIAHIEKMIRQHDKADINPYLWSEIQTHREKIIKLAGLHGVSNIRVTSLGISNHKSPYYLHYGCRLGWFIDPDDRSVLVFLPNQQPELLQGGDCLPLLAEPRTNSRSSLWLA